VPQERSGLRNIGDYVRSGNWEDYWRTKVSYTVPGKLLVRGYPIEEIVERLSYAEALYLTVRGELPTKKQARVLDAVLTCILDHQFIASHTPAARIVASANPESPVPGIAAGVLAVGMNTVAPTDAARMVQEAVERMRKEKLSQEETARRVVTDYLKSGRRIAGLGHPTHKEYDMRGEALNKVARQQGIWGPHSPLFEAIHAEFTRASGKRLPINVDGRIACVLLDLGFDVLEMAGIAIVAVMPGIIAHVVEEIKEGVPLRIIPEALGSKYVGPQERHLPPR
jgi:citrate synthase